MCRGCRSQSDDIVLGTRIEPSSTAPRAPAPIKSDCEDFSVTCPSVTGKKESGKGKREAHGKGEGEGRRWMLTKILGLLVEDDACEERSRWIVGNAGWKRGSRTPERKNRIVGVLSKRCINNKSC